MKMRKKT